MKLTRLLLAFVLAVPLAARADRGALSVDAGGGMSMLQLSAPLTAEKKELRSFTGTVWLGGRYALTNWLEIGVSGFYEPPVTVWHNAVRVQSDGYEYPGTLTHQVSRYGASVGPRVSYGMVWRITAGLEAGLGRRVYSGFKAIDDSIGNGEGLDYGLRLADISIENLLVSPYLGLEWTGGDHWSVAILPRAQFLLGAQTAYCVVVPVTVGWSWYL